MLRLPLTKFYLASLASIILSCTSTFAYSLSCSELVGILEAGEASAIHSGAREMAELQTRLERQHHLHELLQMSDVSLAYDNTAMDAGQASGDLVRVVPASDGHLHFFLGDVMGHGPEAAIHAIFLHSIIGERSFADSLPHKRANDVLTEIERQYGTRNNYACMGHVDFDPASGRLQFARAGNIFCYVIHRNGHVEEIADTTGRFLGIFQDSYSKGHGSPSDVQLQPGDKVVMISDGYWEAADVDNIILGNQFEDLLHRHRVREKTPQDVIHQVRALVEDPHDDRSILVFQWKQ